MSTFEDSKRELLQPLLFEAGAALFDCQSFENSISYLLFLLARLGTPGLPVERTVAILENDEKKTAGQLIALFKAHAHVDAYIEDALATALAARNKLIHRFFTDNIERVASPAEHDALIQEIRGLRRDVQKCEKLFDPITQEIAEHLDGIRPEELGRSIELRFMEAVKKH